MNIVIELNKSDCNYCIYINESKNNFKLHHDITIKDSRRNVRTCAYN